MGNVIEGVILSCDKRELIVRHCSKGKSYECTYLNRYGFTFSNVGVKVVITPREENGWRHFDIALVDTEPN